jgi:hypothetical protein
MFFLIRVTFWIGLVLVLVPAGKSQVEAQGPQISAFDAWSVASATFSDLSQFCTRQEQACAIGGQVMSAIGHRAQSGAKTIYAYLTEPKASSDDKATPAEAVPPSQSTLTAADRALDWRGPPLRREARAQIAAD